MAGNQRQQRRTHENKVNHGKVSLADALNATQQHTVPVLPASDLSIHEQPTNTELLTPPAPPKSSRPSGRSRRPSNATTDNSGMRNSTSRTSYAGATSAPHEANTGITAASSPRQTTSDSGGASSLAKAQLVLPDIMADSISTEKTTRVLPALDTGLVPIREQNLPVAPAAEPEATAILIRGANKPPRHNYARVVPRRQGPRPMAAQFILAMMLVMILFSIFTLVSPLGRNVASLGLVQAYANAIPWVPTPTPKPKPKPASVYDPPPGANPGAQAIINEIVAVFGTYSQGALNIAHCESGYDPNARNPYAIGNSHAEGVFQILYPSTWDTTTYANYSPYDASLNIHAAYQIFSRDGDSWREWACQP